jgi:hypothetical protein
VNKSWLANTGYRKEQVVGKSDRDFDIWANSDTRQTMASATGCDVLTKKSVQNKEGNVRTGLLSIEK